MKKSISFLPKHKQADLNLILGLIQKYLPEAGMIILYGSYARNDYVSYDSRSDFGQRTIFQSDYDILVLTHGINTDKANDAISKVGKAFYDKSTKMWNTTFPIPLSIIQDDILKFNEAITQRRYFETTIKTEGIILYDKDVFKLARAGKLNFQDIQRQAQEYFTAKMDRAKEHIGMSELAFNNSFHKDSIFHLHQALENIYHSVLLVHSLFSPKKHDLKVLNDSVRSFSPEVSGVFSIYDEDKDIVRLFEKVQQAYIDARYNPKYEVDPNDIILITQKVKAVIEKAIRVNELKIRDYGEQYEKSKNI